MLERSKYKFHPLTLPEELPAFFHGTPHASTFSVDFVTHTHLVIHILFKSVSFYLMGFVYLQDSCWFFLTSVIS